MAAEQGVFMAPLHYKKLQVECNNILVVAKGDYDVIVHNNPIIRKRSALVEN